MADLIPRLHETARIFPQIDFLPQRVADDMLVSNVTFLRKKG